MAQCGHIWARLRADTPMRPNSRLNVKMQEPGAVRASFMLKTAAPMEAADLSSCAQEPIHIPGSIQPHGCLLALDSSSLHVSQASANTKTLFPDGVLGKSLEELFGPQWKPPFQNTVQNSSLERNPLYLGTVKLAVKGDFQPFDVIVHRPDNVLTLELESSPVEQAPSFQELYPLVRKFMADLQTVSTTNDLSALAAREVRRITGFDRVLIYQFDANWNGHVIAEDLDASRSLNNTKARFGLNPDWAGGYLLLQRA